MPRKEQGWITFQSSEEERQILEHYCQQSQRTKTEILRELVRGLSQAAAPSKHNQQSDEQPAASPSDHPHLSVERSALRLSARNVFPGWIKRIVTSPVNTEITLEIAPGVDLVSVITTASAEEMNLQQGKMIYAVIKSSNVILADPNAL
jgi:molybdopterin-binding protein